MTFAMGGVPHAGPRQKFLLIVHEIKSQKVYGESKRIENLEFFFKEGQKKIFCYVVIKTGKFE